MPHQIRKSTTNIPAIIHVIFGLRVLFWASFFTFSYFVMCFFSLQLILSFRVLLLPFDFHIFHYSSLQIGFIAYLHLSNQTLLELIQWILLTFLSLCLFINLFSQLISRLKLKSFSQTIIPMEPKGNASISSDRKTNKKTVVFLFHMRC